MKKFAFVLAMMFGLCLTVNACSTNDHPNDDPETEQPDDPTPTPDTPAPNPDKGEGVTGKALIIYYSFTNNSHIIATELQKQTEADILRVEPAEENVDYNDYSIGLPMMNLIQNHPDDPASYPAIKTKAENLADYDTILIVAPLWWNHMAAPLQTIFFEQGEEMAGKYVGLIVSSGESSIEGVEADVKRLIPKAKHLTPSLWILRSRTNQCPTLIADWLKEIHID